MADKREMDSMIGADFEPDWWERNWLPFTLGYGGDMHFVEANGTAQGGKIISFYDDDEERLSPNPSMKHWLDTLALSMEDGTYKIDGKIFTSESEEE